MGSHSPLPRDCGSLDSKFLKIASARKSYLRMQSVHAGEKLVIAVAGVARARARNDEIS